MSCLLHPPLPAACGAATEAIARGDERLALAGRALAVGSFVGVSLALYANVPAVASRWPTLGARSGREFMLTSGLARIDEEAMRRRHHAVALSLFALYPAWFELRRALARR